MTVIARNPIMPGFYPDPSVCAVGKDYYLINSSFAYFPGLPIMHSRDLVHWEQIGNAMHRQEQLPLKDAGLSQGLFAPTMRYHDGMYYVICTNISHGGNYVVTAQNPAGPWSDPCYLEGADGIDPSLFFDEDGKCYYIGTHPNPEGCRYGGDYYIWIRELDFKSMKLVGETYNVWNGAMKGIPWPEGPHLYRKDGYYYILHAEGGTGPDHAVCVCRSRNLFGPYENNYCNPILTHRHLGQAYPVKYVGHGDLFETPDGQWYMVMLAVRPLEGYTTMGRETFLAKVVWENGWPVVNPGAGMLTSEVEIDLPQWNPAADSAFDTAANCVPGSSRTYRFGKMKKLGDEFLALRNPGDNLYQLDKEGLRLAFRSCTLKDKASPSYLAVRQQHHFFEASAVLNTKGLTEGRRAGLALLQNEAFHLRAELFRDAERALCVEVILCWGGEDEKICSAALGDGKEVSGFQDCEACRLILRVEGLQATVELEDGAEAVMEGSEAVNAEEIETLREPGRKRALLCRALDIRALSTEAAGGFVGCTVGMYAAADSENVSGSVCFSQFSYRSLSRRR